ncbi:PD-(D/E)XK nuclease family protein [Shewanella nanhaiensis]|uniref:PD-(D/E)XK nuclease family protein n=1 Tax=Shewanella nanhaiensis TaxID=2864872 RepID=A0ABS7EAE8_9GAMM|nr:PD-(D/E)XK nuclease family protein [Shewanella nanhaiensis]MBW8186575.1 PD-(D/E)XK nuclease family protein [Shewanella nanhaiensis]
MINEQFFNHVRLLEKTYFRKPQYNLFRVLRSESDEVRLHSRFLGDLLNPKGGHQHGGELLRLFLDKFDLSITADALVDVEYKNIDILIRSGDTAVIVENKIYAGDQKEQLSRYYEVMQKEGYTNIKIIYLTLMGHPPSDDSTVNLSPEFIKQHLIHASYDEHIHELINRYIELSATDAPLREALIQYADIISKLTHKLENKEHMEELKQLLKTGSNLAAIPNLLEAYNEVLVDYQLDIWKRISEEVRNKFGSLIGDSICNKDDPEEAVRAYVNNRRGSKYLNVETQLEGYDDTYLLVEQDHHIYFGVYCPDAEGSDEYKRIRRVVEDASVELNSEVWSNMPVAFYAEPKINFKNLGSEELEYLSSEHNRQAYADFIVTKLQEVVSLLK